MVLPVPKEAVEKRYEFRRGYRRQLLARYFSRGKLLRFPLEALRFSLPCYPYFFEPSLHEDGEKVFFLARGERLLLSPDGLFLLSEGRRQIPFSGVLCGIFSENGKDLGLGIIRGIDVMERVLTVWGVPIHPERPVFIVPSCLRLDESGEERGRCLFFSSPLQVEKR